MKKIIDYIRDSLLSAGHARFTAIADAAGVARSLPRKIAYGERQNPGVVTVQPLIDYFKSIEHGENQLPPKP